jgi:glycosyltransferase involved in cell wall biosynthesis
MVTEEWFSVRIALVVHKFPPTNLGGTEVYSYNLARELAERHDVCVFYREDASDHSFCEEWQDRDGFRAWRVGRAFDTGNANPAALFFDTFANQDVEASFARFLDEAQPDLVHFQHLMLLSYRLIAEVRRRGLPCLLTLHDYWFLCANSQLIWPDGQICQGKAWGMNCVRCGASARFSSRLLLGMRPALAPLFAYRDRLVRRAALGFDQYISPSRFLIKQYVEAGFPAGRFEYLENCIPVDDVRRVAWQPSDGPLRVTFLGSLAWQKGVHVLIQAFNELPRGVARLRIWGDPTAFPEYAESLSQALTNPDGEFMGRIANDRIGEVLADSDVMVVPSLWFENSPVVIQEARAAGVPVVVSGHGALAEKVRHGIDGLHFPPGNASELCRALLRLVHEPELLPRLCQGIRPAMDLSEHGRRVESIYGRLMNGAVSS